MRKAATWRRHGIRRRSCAGALLPPADEPITLPGVAGRADLRARAASGREGAEEDRFQTEVYHLATAPGRGGGSLAGLAEDWATVRTSRSSPAATRTGTSNKRELRSGTGRDRPGVLLPTHYFGPPQADARERPVLAPHRRRLAWMRPRSISRWQLDSATNNTSLVLAFELVDSGKVLLFAGRRPGRQLAVLAERDSGSSMRSTTVTGAGPAAADGVLQGRPSRQPQRHPKAKGLELMQSDDFVAFIPVNHDMAVKKGWGKMPLAQAGEGAQCAHARPAGASRRGLPAAEHVERKAFAAALITGGPMDRKAVLRMDDADELTRRDARPLPTLPRKRGRDAHRPLGGYFHFAR